MNRSMHTATNVLLLNLSLSDMLFVAFSVPGLLAMEICNGRWPFSEAKGKIMQQTTILVATSSVFTMMAIAFERYERGKRLLFSHCFMYKYYRTTLKLRLICHLLPDLNTADIVTLFGTKQCSCFKTHCT